MQTEGPQLETLLRRLADTPAELLWDGEGAASADVVAIVCDTVRAMQSSPPPELEANALAAIAKLPQPQQSLIAIVCWLLFDESFRQQPHIVPDVWKLLRSERLELLAKLTRPQRFVEDPDRREELVRLCLSALGMRPQGESSTVAADRLMQLDSVERDRVLRATAAAEKRAREIREAMARKKALESASRYGE